ncbi:MAG TPA: hypothetical protein VFX95_06295 [Caulobacteraceae bacterium]|nr:hypothetical protein [Caulobacteraceae bacterium]
MPSGAAPNPGSFRDPTSRVFELDGAIVRGLDRAAADNFEALAQAPFYRQAEAAGSVVGARLAGAKVARQLAGMGWVGALEHERVPLISYPYEWTFSMLKAAALLHLELLAAAYHDGWTIKDSTPYNVQFVGSRPVFIDTPSFTPREPGDYWTGYRQFCMLFLYPLMLKAHLGIDFQPLLRAKLDGLTPVEFARYFSGLRRLKKGVPSHVVLPASLEAAVERRERDNVPAKARPAIRQSEAMVLGLIDGMRRLVEGLNSPIRHTDWSEYANRHSYEQAAFDEKVAFVKAAAASRDWNIAWDLGGNTGSFSRICADHARYVITADGDHDAVEKLFLSERAKGGETILPLVLDLANISPAQGWAGAERAAFDGRNRPDLVIALALIHHMALSANIPIPMFLDWLRSLDAHLVIEFVDRDDEMVEKLLKNKRERYDAYNLAAFESELGRRFEVIDRKPLKGGRRHIYFCAPGGAG